MRRKTKVKKVVTVGPMYERFGRAVRKARQAIGLRQEELGDKVGLVRTSIVNIEHGRQRVLLDDVFTFAKALRIKPEKLFKETVR